MAELVDARDLKSLDGNVVWVRVPPPAPVFINSECPNAHKHRSLARDIDSAVNWISGLIGAAVDKRVAGFEQQERTNPLLASHFRENFALEFALAKARKYRKGSGRLPKGEEFDALYSFLIPTHRIHDALPT